jgi:DNA-binding NarL/FixJ family response regulator
VSENNLKLLWLDDDAPAVRREVNGVDVTCVQTCADADRVLRDPTQRPDVVIVDLVVPQAGWHASEFLKLPGINFTKYVSEQYSEGPKVVVFSIAVSDATAAAARKAGALQVYDKLRTSFTEVLDDVKSQIARV